MNILFRAMLLCIVLPLRLAEAQTETDQARTAPAEKGESLVVHIETGDIRISGWDRNQVMVRPRGFDADDLKQLTVTRSGRTVTVGFGPEGGSRSRGLLHINVPASFNIDLETSSGDLMIDGPLTGTLVGSTAGGNLKIGDVGGTVNMETAGGSIVAGTVTGDAGLTTAGGDIRTADISGNAALATAGGEIHTGMVGRNLNAETAGGDIRFGAVGGEVTASTAGGTIQGDSVKGVANLTTAGGNIRLASGAAAVKATTAGGNIRIGSVSGSLQATTAGGDIHTTLAPDGRSPSRLTTSAGSIMLVLPGDARATIRALLHDRDTGAGPRFTIRSDFPGDARERAGAPDRKEETFILNGGGSRIELETHSGNIIIKRGP